MRKSGTTRQALAILLMLCLAACAGGEKQVRQLTSEDYYQEARRQMAEEKFEEAKVSLEEARRHYRSGDLDAGLLALLGDVHFGLEEYDEAISVYQEFLKLHPRNPLAAHVQYRIGLAYVKTFRSKDRDQTPAFKAREAFRHCLEDYPRSPEALEAQARIEEVSRSLAEGELFVGRFYFRKENYRGAISRFETILRDYPGSGLEEETLYYLGESHRHLKDDGKAREYFQLLLERYPSGKYLDNVRDYLQMNEGRG